VLVQDLLDLAAARLLGLHDGLFPASLPACIGPGLEDIRGGGIVQRGEVVTWAGPTADAEGAPAVFGELTGRKCSDSSYHAR
jgi:hypothetical protein